jgi:integral membrane protein
VSAWVLWRLAKFVALVALAGGMAGALARPARAEEGGAVEADAVALRARSEGASLLALLAVSVGRRALQLELGGAPALLGWVHGVGVLIWLQVLVVGGRALGWSVPSMLSGLVTLLPFGTLLYERWGPMRAR